MQRGENKQLTLYIPVASLQKEGEKT